VPEYLSPGVYVEEVPSGAKPIEGVSTSTVGMVGVTERGPVDSPTLVTSFGDFTRRFGGYLDHRVFTGGRDALPYAVQGFFENGGRRVYVNRIVGADATFASVDLFGEPLQDPASTALSARAAEDAQLLLIDDGTNIANGDSLLLVDGARSEYVSAQSDPVSIGVRLAGRLHGDHPAGTAVDVQNPPTVASDLSANLTGDMSAGGGLALDAAAAGGLSAGDIVRVSDTGNPALTEFVTIAADGAVGTVEPGLLFDHPAATTQVEVVTLADQGPSTTLSDAAVAGAPLISLASTTGIAANAVIGIGAGATREFHVVAAVVSELSIATTPTTAIHRAGVEVIKHAPLLRVHARHEGMWGNRLRLRIRPNSVVATTVAAVAAAGDSPITLTTAFGVSVGSTLDVSRGDPAVRQLRQRVTDVDYAASQVGLDGGADAALEELDVAATIEFDLIVERLDEDDKVVEDEAFEGLAMDPAHPSYAPRIVGAFDRASGEPSDVGASDLIRLSDLTMTDEGADLPEAADLRLSIPTNLISPMMAGGDDDIAKITDATYVGTAAADPGDRTGIQALTTIDEISIVAVPGNANQDVQNAVINHCALMRYRFGVLDGDAGARLADIQAQRQLYDTTYAALYHPWLVIGDRFGRPDDILEIPPSGHVCGVYARTDNERGVHKAPANVVVRGIRDVETKITGGEQDVLNPRHINVIRDFRELNRGIRVWGARTLSSDPEWRYVPVRRLFLFLEKSIERGTQFAVFEPNGLALWATVRRSLTNFLTTVWRDGALAGASAEEAFFVRVGLDVSMTQADIDAGRLIVLVGVAPIKPAEFVIFRISQKTRDAPA
jgi:phage tail sheath protein FI